MIQISPTAPEPALLAEAAAILQNGGLVAFPTETVYGLGANALDPQAVQRIFRAKGRPAHDPLIVHIADMAQLDQVASNVPPLARKLVRHFWPGALTLVLPKADVIPMAVTAGGPTVAVRCPNHPLALALIRAAGVPIAAPSANRFSHTSPTRAQHVLDDLAGRIDLILDGGPTTIGVESTVLEVSGPDLRILRPGGVTAEELAAALGVGSSATAMLAPLQTTPGESADAPAPSPGLLDRHYAPHTPLWLFTLDEHDSASASEMATSARMGEQEVLRKAMLECARAEQRKGGTVALLLADEDLDWFNHTEFRSVSVGSLHDLSQVAAQLFCALRDIDTSDTTLLLARDFPRSGLGLAIRDRLRRAADRIIRTNQENQVLEHNL